MTKKELYEKLKAKVEEGEITADEAEHEYQDFVNPLPQYVPGIGYRGE